MDSGLNVIVLYVWSWMVAMLQLVRTTLCEWSSSMSHLSKAVLPTWSWNGTLHRRNRC